MVIEYRVAQRPSSKNGGELHPGTLKVELLDHLRPPRRTWKKRPIQAAGLLLREERVLVLLQSPRALQLGQVCVALPAVLQGLRPAQLLFHPPEGLAVTGQLQGWGGRDCHRVAAGCSATPQAASPASPNPLHPSPPALHSHSTTALLPGLCTSCSLGLKDWPSSPAPSIPHSPVSHLPLPSAPSWAGSLPRSNNVPLLMLSNSRKCLLSTHQVRLAH